MSELRFFVVGDAQPAGSKRAFKHPSTGRTMVVDANAKAKPWQAIVAATAAETMNGWELLDGPLEVELCFYQKRPRSHYGTGRNSGKLRDSAPDYPTGRPDALKLARGVEDALSGVIYRDDSQIVDERLQKRYGTPVGVQVSIKTMPTPSQLRTNSVATGAQHGTNSVATATHEGI